MANKLQNTLNNLPTITRYLLILGVIIFISLLSPAKKTFDYQFEVGAVWQYEDYRAPFDFPILKKEEVLEAEKLAIQEDITPYYHFDLTTVENQQKNFNKAFDQQLQSAERNKIFNHVRKYPKRYKRYGLSFLDRIYQRGITQLEPFHQRAKDFKIIIVKENKLIETLSEKVLTVPAANEILSDSLPYSKLYEPEFLLPILTNTLVPNIYFSDSLTRQFLDQEIAAIDPSSGLVKEDELIVKEGSILTEAAAQKLISCQSKYDEANQNHSFWGVFVGYFLLTLLIIGVYLMYLKVHATEVFKRFPNLVFMFLWVVVMSYFVYIVESTENLNAYLVPFCIVPMIVKNFFNERLALFTHIVIVLIASLLTSLGYEFTFLQILAGIVAVLVYTDTKDWSKFFFAILYIFLAYVLGYMGLELIQHGSILDIEWSVYTWLIINAFLLLITYPLIPLMERLFGYTSSITLVELGDLNRPLLKELSLKAPGTLQHSLQVANLCEAAANAIGANALLVKTGALYHDIGKVKQATYFIENQRSTQSPHLKLSSIDSAKIILDHVSEGVKIAKKHKLPTAIISFIKTHHGTTYVEYFLRNQLKVNPSIDKKLFQYTGPIPSTKEETILMIADSLEAASKSINNPTGRDIDNLVDNIIQKKIKDGQLEKSNLSFSELEKCATVFKKLLRNINHVRVEYPEDT